MLSTTDLAAMRSTLDASLPDTCQVTRKTPVPDGAGGQTVTYPNAGSAVACRIAPATDAVRRAEDIIAGRVAQDAPWLLTLPNGTDVVATDRVTSGGRTFEVSVVLAPRSWELDRRLLCREVS